jgi:hypothetical protein
MVRISWMITLLSPSSFRPGAGRVSHGGAWISALITGVEVSLAGWRREILCIRRPAGSLPDFSAGGLPAWADNGDRPDGWAKQEGVMVVRNEHGIGEWLQMAGRGSGLFLG